MSPTPTDPTAGAAAATPDLLLEHEAAELLGVDLDRFRLAVARRIVGWVRVGASYPPHILYLRSELEADETRRRIHLLAQNAAGPGPGRRPAQAWSSAS